MAVGDILEFGTLRWYTSEGTYYKNLFATWCLGPVLVRNPLMMKEVLHCVLGEDYRETDFSLEEKAQEKLIADLAK